VVDGFAVLAYQDPNHKTYSGLIDMVTSILLVREDLDPNPIIDERKAASDAADSSTKAAWHSLDRIIRQGPDNYVQTFEGFIESSFERARAEVKPKNYLNLN
jgi:hypothetical protein